MRRPARPLLALGLALAACDGGAGRSGQAVTVDAGGEGGVSGAVEVMRPARQGFFGVAINARAPTRGRDAVWDVQLVNNATVTSSWRLPSEAASSSTPWPS